MKPKEKAKELFDKYCLAIKSEGYEFEYWTNITHAKNCALICVDEILNAFYSLRFGNALDDELEYWQQVKQQIEKL